MKKLIIRFCIIIISVLCLLSYPTNLAMAIQCGGVETSVIECGDDDGKGSAIISILEDYVIPIMTAGIAVLATIGITISGVQYLTAGGNEEQIKKSKRRIFEIVLGLAAYAVVAALLSWLLPTWK